MTWNYRVIRKTNTGYDHLDELYAIHEVYYSKDGKPEMVTVEPVGIVGEDYAELCAELAHYTEAFSKPVLNYEDIGNAD